jgi:hypothetical protein
LVKHLHVKFVYDHSATDKTDPSSDSASKLTTTAISTVMSWTWIEALQTAAKSCDDDQIYVLIENIPPDCTHLIEGLKQLTDQFAFDQILNLTQAQ